MNRYRGGMLLRELIALDIRGWLYRESKQRTRAFAKQMANSVFGRKFSHPPNVIHRIDKIDTEGNVIRTNDLSHGRHRGQRFRPR